MIMVNQYTYNILGKRKVKKKINNNLGVQSVILYFNYSDIIVY